MQILKGYGTYIVGGIMILLGIATQVFPGTAPDVNPTQMISEGFAILMLRRGIGNIQS